MMSDILMRELVPDDLEPDLVAIALPIYRKWEAAALRVAANHTARKTFALPKEKGTPEAVLAERFRQIAKARPAVAQAASIRAADQLTLLKVQRRLGRVVSTDFTTRDSVDDLTKAPVSPPADSAAVLRLLDRHYAQLGMQRTTSGALAPQDRVMLDLIRVVCIDETNGFLGSEWGDDEIYLGGATIDEQGKTGEFKPFKVGDFSDNDRKDFDPPKRLYTWQVGGGGSYPKHYFASLFLFEKDEGDLDATFEKLFRAFTDEVAAKIAALLGTAVGALFGGPLGAAAGALLGWLVGWLMGKLVNKLIAIWEDDPFVPKQVEFIIPNWTARLDEPSKVFHFTGPGEYAVRYRWSAIGQTAVIAG
jgi:hypothetical protein